MLDIWKNCGLINPLWDDKTEKVANAIYDAVHNLMSNESIKEKYTVNTGLEEWWNSFFPTTKEELCEVMNFTETDDALAEELLSELKFNKDIDYSLFYYVYYNLINKFSNQDEISDFSKFVYMTFFDGVTLKDFKHKGKVTKLYTYQDIYNLAVDLITNELLAYFEIYNFTKNA